MDINKNGDTVSIDNSNLILTVPPQHQQQQNSDTISNNSSSDSQINDLYIVLYDYKALHDDELNLVKGTKIKIISKDYKVSGDDGWWTGICVNDGKKGIFPYNYVELYNNESTCSIDGQSLSRVNWRNSVNMDDTNTLTNNEDSGSIIIHQDVSPNEIDENIKNDKESSDDQTSLPTQIPYNQLEFRDCIGAGGFGKVFKGYWLRNNDNSDKIKRELVAIKEARIEGDREDLITTIRQNVLQEAKLFWMLKHPNIIELKGVCFKEPHFCLIMEYAKGGSLGRLLSVRKIGFPPYILINWALQVSQGMYYLHEKALPNRMPIIHRDLKSSNILLSEDATNGEHRLTDIILKLTDFGLARELQKSTNEITAAGTYSHMPPEVIKSSIYSKASDVWSFGVLLWELLTGEIPYKGIDPLAIAYGVAVNKLTLPIPSTCPQVFSDLIHACWHTDSYKRITFEEIIECLTQISNSSFALTSYESFWTMQQDWKTEIQEMFDEIKTRENELENREEELKRISLRQQAYENMLRQRERELEEREKDLAFRELTVALQQLNPVTQQQQVQQQSQQQNPPEPKKRRRMGGRLLNSFLRSSSSSNSNHSSSGNNSILASNKSIDISSPSDFQHHLSIQPELLNNNNNLISLNFNSNHPHQKQAQHSTNSSLSTPTEQNNNNLTLNNINNNNNSSVQFICSSLNTLPNNNSNNTNTNNSPSSSLLSPISNGSPSLRFKFMLSPTDSNSTGNLVVTTSQTNSKLHKTSSLIKQKAHISPNHSNEQLNKILQSNDIDQYINRSSSVDPSKLNNKYSNVSSTTPTLPTALPSLSPLSPTNTSNNLYSKKIGKLLYDIGSFLSFVGLGKDYKQHHHNQKLTTKYKGSGPIDSSNLNDFVEINFTNSGINNNNNTMTRRSQDKKQTATTTTTTTATAVGSKTLISPTSDVFIYQPDQPKISPQSLTSQSLTRQKRAYPYRFKSLTSQFSNLVEHQNENLINYSDPHYHLHNDEFLNTYFSSYVNDNDIKRKEMNLLSPLVSSQNTKSISINMNNKVPLTYHQKRTLLKNMHKKYSKSVDYAHYLNANLVYPTKSLSERSTSQNNRYHIHNESLPSPQTHIQKISTPPTPKARLTILNNSNPSSPSTPKRNEIVKQIKTSSPVSIMSDSTLQPIPPPTLSDPVVIENNIITNNNNNKPATTPTKQEKAVKSKTKGSNAFTRFLNRPITLDLNKSFDNYISMGKSKNKNKDSNSESNKKLSYSPK